MRQKQQRKAALFELLEGRTHLSATISGLVHNDVNGDGLFNEFSAPPTTRVYIDSNQNGRRDSRELSVLTDSTGHYEFKNIPGGKYVVRIDLPKGWNPSNRTALSGTAVIFTEGTDTISVPNALIHYGKAPWGNLGQDAQHTGTSPFAGLPLDQVQAVADLGADGAGHEVTYGSPLFTKFGTIIMPAQVNGQYLIAAYSHSPGGTSTLLWYYISHYEAPPTGSTSAVFQPVLAPNGKLYFPEAAGTIGVIQNPDRYLGGNEITARPVKSGLFYYSRKDFLANPSFYRNNLFINTPLTIDPKGNVYFGVYSKVHQDGVSSVLARVTPNGKGSSVAADVATGRAPVLSNNNQFAYVMTQSSDGTATLSRFRGTRLMAAGSVVLRDPSNNALISLTAGETAPPTVGPDGDVFVPVPADADGSNAGAGWVLHYSADLKKKKFAGAFNSDVAVSIVPASMVPSYHGKSSYLVLTAFQGYDLDNDLTALLDPTTGVNSNGVKTMKVVASLNGVANVFSSAAVDPSTGNIYMYGYTSESEDSGFITMFAWNVTKLKTLIQLVNMTDQVNADRGPVTIGPNGEVYAVTNGTLYAAF